MAFFISMVILINSPSCLFCIDSYGLEYLLVPFVSIFTYIPILIEIFIIFIKQQKYTIHIFASIIVLLIIYNLILLIGTPLETNNLEKTLPFSTVTITYDSKKDEPKVNPEKLKYYHNGHTYYFLLEPGTYKIYTESNNRIDIHKNKFYRYNKIFESAKHGFKISKIKKENQIYRYEVDYENSKIYDKISKDDSNYIRSFESDEECILVKYGFNKLDEIKIVKQD